MPTFPASRPSTPSTETWISAIDFNARPAGKAVRLTWRTSAEVNTQNFMLERSVDGGRTFLLIGTVAARNDNAGAAYTFLDDQLEGLTGDLFYRLRSRDFGGAEQVFGPVTVRLADSFTDRLLIFPNPQSPGKAINIQGAAVRGLLGTKMELRATDGRLIAVLHPVNEGSYVLPNLSAGVYLLRTHDEKGKPKTGRFVVR